MCKPVYQTTSIVSQTSAVMNNIPVDSQYDDALAQALFAQKLSAPKKRSSKRFASPPRKRVMDGFGRDQLFTASPTNSRRKSLSSKISSIKKRSFKRLTNKSHDSAVIEIAANFEQKRKSKLPSSNPVAPIVDELASIRKLRGEERLVAFFEKYHPERIEEASTMLRFGGSSEIEMWDELQIKYGVNQRRRLWAALKVILPTTSNWHRNVDTYLADCSSAEEVEAVITQHTLIAKTLIEKIDQKNAKSELTWSKGLTNAYQQVPDTELND